MKKTFAAVLLLALAMAFPRNVPAEEIPLPADEAYRKAVFVLRNMGAFPTYLDADRKIVKTDATLTRLTEEECDCGSRLGRPFINDRKTKTTVAYEVQFKPIDAESCHMSLMVTIDGFVDVYEGSPAMGEKSTRSDKKLLCRSTGVLEKRFEEQLLK